MPKYVPIKGDELVLVEQEIKTKKVVTKKMPVNHIWIYDRSGSMHWLLPELCSQLIILSKGLPKGDSLSLGWFSSEGDFNWIFKGFRIIDNADYKSLEAAIKKNSSSRCTTCFSEILTDTDIVIEDLSVISKTFSLNFFTDGYPVVSNYQKELKDILSAVKKIKGRINTAMFIGYGSYYNKELLSQMSETMGAMLIHSSEIQDYKNQITKLVKLTENSEPKEEVNPLVSDSLAIFSVTDQGVVTLSVDENKIYVAPEKGKTTKIYYLSTNKPDKKSWDKIDLDSINFGENKDHWAQALYAAALVLSQQTKTDLSMEVIGKVGDKALIDQLNNAFMVEEFGAAEEKINNAINDSSFRFLSGRDPSYLPKEDAFCVYDALNLLIDDEKAAFFPYHEKFKYEKIGVKTAAKEGYATFKPDKASKCPFNTMIWHESRLNLSVQTTVKGTIDLQDVEGKTAADMGFISSYPTFVFRNYTFVKDGHTHTKIFYLTSSEDSYKKFKNEGIVTDDDFKISGVYAIDIGKLPAINRVLAGNEISGTELCQKVLTEHKLKAEVKVLKWLKKEELGDVTEDTPQSFTEEQAAFLKANCIQVDRGGLYSPPTEKADPVDFYMAKAFDIKLTGIATLPPVKKVVEKIASGKNRTASESLLEVGIVLWNSVRLNFKSEKEKIDWFKNTIGDRQKKMKAIRSDIQKTKMAVILGRKWFSEFTSRENCELTIENVKCVFALSEEKVGY